MKLNKVHKTQQQHARRAGAVRHAVVSSPLPAFVWEACAACGKYHRDNYTGPCDEPRESFTLGAGTDGTLQLY